MLLVPAGWTAANLDDWVATLTAPLNTALYNP